MKRALVLLSLICLLIAGFLSIRGVMPFMAIYGSSMQPIYRAGDLIWIDETQPEDVVVGDIIVYSIPTATRQAYNYPEIVAHRVIKVNTEGGITFRTKGDNSGQDPFTVRSQDLRGKVGNHISYLGFPLLFFQSQQGLIFSAVALCLLALYLYSDELEQGKNKLHRLVFAPIISENERLSRNFEQKFEISEKTTQLTCQALNDFALAIAEYAKHLQSHTSAVQSMAKASNELKISAAQQNQVLAHLLENVEIAKPARPRELTVSLGVSSPPTTVLKLAKADKENSVITVGPAIESNQTVIKVQREPPQVTSPAITPTDNVNGEKRQLEKAAMGNLTDLFTRPISEDNETNKLAEGMDDLNVNSLLEEGLRLKGKVKKQQR